ncbi:probable rhamnogalacturonate lyase B [Brassica napus]|nr:probable rhamnogalacturonate lyase B [Brassica napus]
MFLFSSRVFHLVTTTGYRRHLLRQKGWMIALIMLLSLFEIVISQNQSYDPETIQVLQLLYQDGHVVIDNGIFQLTLSNPEGFVTGVRYNGIENVLAYTGHENDRGYWDLVWNFPGKKTKKTKGTLDRIEATKMEVITQNDEQIEISFSRTWNASSNVTVPVNIDKRFVVLRNSSGFYTYAIFERLQGWPAVEIDNIRLAIKLDKDKFDYMAISDERQRYMPLPDDRIPPRGKPLAYPEAVQLLDPVEPEFKGDVDDKYEYSMESKDIKVHGWISTNDSVGFWQITPSNEFRSAGPLKQFLGSHVGPTNLAIFHSTHYVGEDLIMKFEEGEAWKKVFGPVFIYLNSFPKEVDPLLLWLEAKNQTKIEEEKWPYNFTNSSDFPASDQRGHVSGRLLVRDRYISSEDIPANGSCLGLAAPGDVGAWQREYKGYQFWSKADEEGYFCINNVRSGRYNLYAFAPGFIGDYHNETVIDISPGSNICLGELVYEPPRDGPTLWEIGVPDRTAAEFYIPDPNPMFVNKLYVNSSENKYRQYGLWERYSELYPDEDMVYDVDVDDYSKDWFYMQVTRKLDDGGYNGTTWEIKFQFDDQMENLTGDFKLRIALATSNVAELQVRVNNVSVDPPLFTTGQIGKDNTIARHGIHGLYWLYSVDVPASSLCPGNNSIYLTQPLAISPFQGFMYDYIRLEYPDSVNHIT